MSQTELLFSIIIPSYNRAHFIGTAIKSVQNQTYTNWEVIVIDDGSTDSTKEIVKQFIKTDDRIKYFYQENNGRSSARNIGIEKSRGDYICFLDDDDYYMENFLEEFNNKLKQLNSPVCVLLCRQIEKENGILNKYDLNRNKYSANLIKMYLRYPNVQSLCTSRKIFEEIKFDERFSIGEDLHLFLRIFLLHPSYYIDKYLCVNVYHDRGTMYNELIKMNFMIYNYNSLDMIDDLFLNHNELIEKHKIKYLLLKKYYQKAYFYSSSLLKNGYFIESIRTINKVKLNYFNFIFFYYKLSIYSRANFLIVYKFFNEKIRRF